MKKKKGGTEEELEAQDVRDLADAALAEAELEAEQPNHPSRSETEDVVQRYVDDEDEDEFGEVSFRSIMGGDILQSRFFQRQVIFILFVAALMLVYTGNRYSSQQEIIAIDSLKVKLQQERYNVLTQSSELLNLSRQSNIERRLRVNGDSALVNPTTPPYEIFADD